MQVFLRFCLFFQKNTPKLTVSLTVNGKAAGAGVGTGAENAGLAEAA